MEKKKSTKISLSTLFLIIAIIVIYIIGCLIYKMNSKAKQFAKNNEIQENTNISNTLQDNVAEQLAINTLDKYIELSAYENSNVGPMPSILIELGLETEKNIDLLCSGITNSSEYIKSYTKYEDFKNAMLQYITEDYFLENFSQYKNIDGYVAFCNCTANSTVLEIENLKLTSKNSETYIFDVTFKDVEMYEHYLTGEEMTKNEYLFNKNISFKYIDNKLVISEF